MKVCPVCNESFDEDMRFCEFDGAKLTRGEDDSGPRDQGRLWSLLGIGLLLGALVISATTIIFMPKSPGLPPVVSSEPRPSTPLLQPNTQPSQSPALIAEARPSDFPEVVVVGERGETAPPPEAKKKDKLLAGDNLGPAAPPNPKAAARAADGSNDRLGSTLESPVAPSPPPKDAAPVNSVRATSGDPTPKAASSEPKKDDKRPAATSSQTDKDSAKKKPDDKDKKKSGGFLRVFKKIFGKD